MTSSDEALEPCPFCGAGETRVDINTYWTGMKSEVLNAAVKHWCKRHGGRLQSFLEIKGEDREDAIKAWNTRAIMKDEGK